MKKSLLLAVIIFIVKISFGQITTMFNDTLLPFGVGAYANRTICEDDSFYYVGGVYYNGIIPVNQYFITKLDENGDVCQKRTYFDTTAHYHADPYNSMLIDNNKIISCIITENVSQYEIKSKVIAIDKNTLDTIWTRTYPHPDTASIQSNADKFSDLTAIKTTPDNCYILTGNYMTAGNERSYLMKIDSVGNTLWTKTYSSYYTFFFLQIAIDSGFYIPCTYNGSVLKLLKVDKYGNYKWNANINSNSNPSYPLAVALQPNGNIAVTSAFWYDLTNSLRGITVSSINPITKSLVWEKNYIIYKDFVGITLHQAMGVETLSDGSIIVSGTVQKDGGRKGVILKLNSNGDSLWTKTYDFGTHYNDNDRCQLNDLLVCNDGGFMGVGFFWDKNSNDVAWMFKTDSNGVVGFESPKANGENIKCIIWPNPASDYTKINIGQALNQTSEIIIYNSLGQKVKTYNLQKQQQEIEINLQDFKVGLYYFELRTSDKIIGTGRFIKE